MNKFLSIILLFFLVGCSNTENVQKSSSTLFPPDQQQSFQMNDDAIAMFRKNKDYRDYKILDYVVVDDEKLPKLNAIISFYDSIENNSCNLAFIYGDTIQRIGFAANEVDGVKTYEVADDSELTYVGNGTVSTSIRKIDTNEIINFEISFSYDEQTSTSNFTVDSKK